MAITIKQGDALELPVSVLLNGEAIDCTDVETAEFRLGDRLRLCWPAEVDYDETRQCFLLPLSQQDTFALAADSTVYLDCRVKFIGGGVLGAGKMAAVSVADALSEEVL